MSSFLSDEISFRNLLEDDSSLPLQFDSKREEALPAIANGYAQSLDFDTLPMTGKWCSTEEGWLSIPLSILPTAAAFSKEDPDIAFKGSALSLISGISVKTASGQVLVEERNSSVYANHLRLMLDKPSNWYFSNSDQLMYSKDRAKADIVSGLRTGIALANPRQNKYTGAVSATVNVDNNLYNQGFAERKALLLRSCTATGTPATPDSLETTLNIKLSAIHSFFEALNFPFVNCRLFITFFMNFDTSNSLYKPLCQGTPVDGSAVVAGDVPRVRVAVGSQVPRIFYHALTFTPEQNSAVQKRLEDGFVKKLRYRVSDVYAQQTAFTSVAPFSAPIASNVIKPKRIYALVHPTGVVNGSTWPSPVATGSQYRLTQVQLQMNNTPYLIRSLDDDATQYEALREILPLHGYGGSDTGLSYSDFLSTYHVVGIDVGRQGLQTVDKNQPVSIMFQGAMVHTGAVGTGCDITYLIEREQQSIFSFGTGEIRVESGPLLFK